MPAKSELIDVDGLAVDIKRKRIKNLHLRVKPPEGRVHVSAPLRTGDDEIRFFVTSHIHWIREQQIYIQRHCLPRSQFQTGEFHYFRGRLHRLIVLEESRPASVRCVTEDSIVMGVRPGMDTGKRGGVMQNWYRQQLKGTVPSLLDQWQPVIGVKIAEWRIKRMRTCWGTCNTRAKRIWLNLELAKVPPSCLEYVLVHELVHLLEGYHNERFRRYMDEFMPAWRERRNRLNQFMLS